MNTENTSAREVRSDVQQTVAPVIRDQEKQKTAPRKKTFLLVVLVACALCLIGAFGIYRIFFASVHKSALQNVQRAAKKPLITIAVNPWKASELNATIAKIILQEKMGYPVKLVPVDEYGQWPELAAGKLDATLEVWPSGHKKDIQKYINTDKTVVNGGLLGPVGKIGWYMPTYVKKEYPELASWEGLKDPGNVSLFAAVPGGKGVFYTGDPTWTQYDAQIIKNLGLNFEVKSLGSEASLINAVDTAYHQHKPILFYFWTPHWAQAIYDLSQITLPPYSDACYADTKKGVSCDYPTDKLFKAFWSGFETYAPDAYAFLQNFNYTNQDQIGMLAAVQINKSSVEDVAQYWVNNNESTWRSWIPKQ